MKFLRYLFAIALAVTVGFSVMSNAQGQGKGKAAGKKEEKDSLVFLLSSKSADRKSVV